MAQAGDPCLCLWRRGLEKCRENRVGEGARSTIDFAVEGWVCTSCNGLKGVDFAKMMSSSYLGDAKRNCQTIVEQRIIDDIASKYFLLLHDTPND